MQTYTVQKGGHFSFPRVLRLKKDVKRVQWKIRFQENCNYIIKESGGRISVDQEDWNKLCGVTFSIFNTRKHSAMMGWRYHVPSDSIELAPYYHVAGSRDMFPPLMTVKREELFELQLQIDWKQRRYRWELKKGYECLEHQMAFVHKQRTCGFINFYFGGNRRAPQAVSCDMEMKITQL